MLVSRADRAGAALADRHYPRRKVGARQFSPPGGAVVLVTPDGRAVWVTSVQRFAKHAWPGAWLNSRFRREPGAEAAIASELIRQAVAATRAELGDPPAQGLITFVDPAAVRRKRDPGRCFLRAGFVEVGTTPGGHGRPPLLVLRLAPADMPEPRRAAGRQGELF